MDFVHPELPGRRVRLAYCLNVHPADSLTGVLEGIESITVPLRRRLAEGRPFGVGVYLPASVASELEGDAARRARLAGVLDEHGLVPFTFNAFPHGGFHREGLKQGVFRPRWDEQERVDFTLAVARVAAALNAPSDGHVSISTHAGMHSSEPQSERALERCAGNFGRVAARMSELEQDSGVRVVLGVEPEPRSSANDSGRWSEQAPRELEIAAQSAGMAPERVARHLGLCLDACHASVEFEDLEQAAARACSVGRPLAKFQFSSALRLPLPGADPIGRARLLALDEPTFLHQVTARRADGGLERVGDLAELATRAGQAPWIDALEWRCHFHVPVDLEGPLERGGALATTVSDADALARRLLTRPRLWGARDLHLEIETYTWSLLDRATRGQGALVDGLEREYRHVLELLDAGGWRPAA
jgi:sugar phosphate isomerase/epimerase